MTPQAALQAQLEDRRKRLETAVTQIGGTGRLAGLLREVDDALERIDNGTYGLCDVCHDTIEADRLLSDPLVRLCLDHLTEEQKRALELDLELAARIQGALLPSRDVAVDGWEAHLHYEPAGLVSGDYGDWVLPEGGRDDLFLLLGDVSGKGVAASILMSHLHAIFRPLLLAGLPLGEVMARGNRVFCESTLPMSYATLAAVRASRSGSIQVGNAGHTPPLLVRHGSITPVRAGGVPIGLFCAGDLALEEFRLEPGDFLFLYTDGLSEAANRSGEEFGLDRLEGFLGTLRGRSAGAIASACRDEVRRFQGGEPNRDDLAIMVLRRTG